jgi:predicted phage-related endonuclease
MTEIDLNAVRGHIEVLRYCKTQKAKLKELEDAARAAVEDAMGQHDVGVLDGEPAVHWTHFKESRFDSSAFRDDNPELYETYKTARDKRRFEIV